MSRRRTKSRSGELFRNKHDSEEGKKGNIMREIIGSILYVAFICLIVYLIFQRYFVEGMAGAVKG